MTVEFSESLRGWLINALRHQNILSKKSYYAEFVFLDEDDNPDAAPFEEDDEAVIEKWDFDDYEDDDFSGVKFPEYYTLANKIAVDLWTI